MNIHLDRIDNGKIYSPFNENNVEIFVIHSRVYQHVYRNSRGRAILVALKWVAVFISREAIIFIAVRQPVKGIFTERICHAVFV